MEPMDIDGGDELTSYAIKNNCSRDTYDLLFKTFTDTVKFFFFCLIKIFISIFLA